MAVGGEMDAVAQFGANARDGTSRTAVRLPPSARRTLSRARSARVIARIESAGRDPVDSNILPKRQDPPASPIPTPIERGIVVADAGRRWGTVRQHGTPPAGGVRRDETANHPLMKGLTAVSTSSILLAASNAFGAGCLLRTRRIIAAWRASTWTMPPAAASTSTEEIIGAAPL